MRVYSHIESNASCQDLVNVIHSEREHPDRPRSRLQTLRDIWLMRYFGMQPKQSWFVATPLLMLTFILVAPLILLTRQESIPHAGYLIRPNVLAQLEYYRASAIVLFLCPYEQIGFLANASVDLSASRTCHIRWVWITAVDECNDVFSKFRCSVSLLH